MSDKLNFDEYKSNMFKAIGGMTNALEPLNKRLKPLEMMIYISDGMTFLNAFRADDRSGLSFYIDDNIIKNMMSMSDKELIKRLKD